MTKLNLARIGAVVATGALATVPAFAQTVVDVSAITDAQDTLLAYAAALLALGIAVWAAMKVARMFGSK